MSARRTAMDSSQKRKAQQCKRAAQIRKAQFAQRHVPHWKDLWKTLDVDFSELPAVNLVSKLGATRDCQLFRTSQELSV
jgi:hypothetical protein